MMRRALYVLGLSALVLVAVHAQDQKEEPSTSPSPESFVVPIDDTDPFDIVADPADPPQKPADVRTDLESFTDQKLAALGVFSSSCTNVFMNLALEVASPSRVCGTIANLTLVGPNMAEWDTHCSLDNQAALVKIAEACNSTAGATGSLEKGYKLFDKVATGIACSFYPYHPFLACDSLSQEFQRPNLLTSAEPLGAEATPWKQALEETNSQSRKGCDTRAADTASLMQHLGLTQVHWETQHVTKGHMRLFETAKQLFLQANALVTCVCGASSLVPVMDCYHKHGEGVADSTGKLTEQAIEAAIQDTATKASTKANDTASTTPPPPPATDADGEPDVNFPIVNGGETAEMKPPELIQRQLRTAPVVAHAPTKDALLTSVNVNIAGGALAQSALSGNSERFAPLLAGGIGRNYQVGGVLRDGLSIIRQVRTNNLGNLARQAWEHQAYEWNRATISNLVRRLQYQFGSPCQLFPLPGENKHFDHGVIPNAFHGSFGCGQEFKFVEAYFNLEWWAGNFYNPWRNGDLTIRLENEFGVALAYVTTVLQELSRFTENASRYLGFVGSALHWVVQRILELFDRKLATGASTFSLTHNDFYIENHSSFTITLLQLAIFRVQLDPALSVVLRGNVQCPAVRANPGIAIQHWNVSWCQSCWRIRVFWKRISICVWYPCGSHWSTVWSVHPFGGRWALTHNCGTELW